MSGYISFKYTGNSLIDAILSAVEDAGDAYHHTSQWADDGYDGQPSCIETIEKAAQDAALALAAPVGADAVERVSDAITRALQAPLGLNTTVEQMLRGGCGYSNRWPETIVRTILAAATQEGGA